jgi:hypothetical protein
VSKNDNLLLIGKRGKITFPEITAVVQYLSETSLHWKTVDGKGFETEADEALCYKRLAPHLHFLNWIEKDGWTVSQIIDTSLGTVKAFWSFADEGSERGQRSAIFIDGGFEFTS